MKGQWGKWRLGNLKVGGFKAGDAVNFAVLVNKEGKPQAFDLAGPHEPPEEEPLPILPIGGPLLPQ